LKNSISELGRAYIELHFSTPSHPRERRYQIWYNIVDTTNHIIVWDLRNTSHQISFEFFFLPFIKTCPPYKFLTDLDFLCNSASKLDIEFVRGENLKRSSKEIWWEVFWITV
jgi:hypothetical protein